MSAHASQAFSIANCTDSEDLPNQVRMQIGKTEAKGSGGRKFHIRV